MIAKTNFMDSCVCRVGGKVCHRHRTGAAPPPPPPPLPSTDLRRPPAAPGAKAAGTRSEASPRQATWDLFFRLPCCFFGFPSILFLFLLVPFLVPFLRTPPVSFPTVTVPRNRNPLHRYPPFRLEPGLRVTRTEFVGGSCVSPVEIWGRGVISLDHLQPVWHLFLPVLVGRLIDSG